MSLYDPCDRKYQNTDKNIPRSGKKLCFMLNQLNTIILKCIKQTEVG